MCFMFLLETSITLLRWNFFFKNSIYNYRISDKDCENIYFLRIFFVYELCLYMSGFCLSGEFVRALVFECGAVKKSKDKK